MEDEFYMRRLDAGLFSLQLIDCIIMEVCSSGVSSVNNSTSHQLLAITLYLTFWRPRRLRRSGILQRWITKLHLCTGLNSATKFAKLTIFRDDLAKTTKFTKLTIFCNDLAKTTKFQEFFRGKIKKKRRNSLGDKRLILKEIFRLN